MKGSNILKINVTTKDKLILIEAFFDDSVNKQ